jgi:aarF domain-containing kinase
MSSSLAAIRLARANTSFQAGKLVVLRPPTTSSNVIFTLRAPGRSSMTRRCLHSSYALPCSTLAGSAILSSLDFRARANSMKLAEAKEESSTILACSSSRFSTEKEKRLLKRFIKWIKSWIKSFWDTVLVTVRSTEIAVRMFPLMILTPAAVASVHFFGDQNNLISDLAWKYTVAAMQGLGPVAVKLCQWVATRRDIFPPHICDRLSILHDNGYPHSWAYSHKSLTEAFGDYQAKGLEIEEVIGCGSAAQVYRACLTILDDETGVESKREVAVKVLHPRFQSMVDRDLKFIQAVADLLDSLPSDHIGIMNLPRAAENFGNVLRLQADLTQEAINLKKFRSNFFKDEQDEEKHSLIVFPQPVDGWITSQIIVEDYVHDAIPISEYLKDSTEEGIEIRRELAVPLLRAFLKMVFMDNFVHGDLHPGNVLVRTTFEKEKSSSLWNMTSAEPTHKVKRSIVFLDAGIANSLSPNDQKNLSDLFRAVIVNEGYRAGELLVERAKHERCSQVPGGVDKFAKGVQAIVSEFHDRRKEGLTLGAIRIGSLLSRVLDLCRVHGVEVDPAMACVVISTLVLEGLGRSLQPDLNLLDFARPFVLGRGRV